MNGHFKKLTRGLLEPTTLVILISAAVRTYAVFNTHIVNPDGIHYIHQARALYWQDWASLTSCHINYISILPLLIATAYTVFSDWIVAARSVSMVFGMLTLLPLYFILKRFFEKPVALLTLLVYGLIPVFVSCSVDILRDPVFGFLICMGMLFFVRLWDNPRGTHYPWTLPISCLFYLLSVSARVEGIMFIAASGAYLLFSKIDAKPKNVLWFTLPLVATLMAAFIGSKFLNIDGLDFHRLDKVRIEATQFVQQYNDVRTQLRTMTAEATPLLGEFLRKARELVWFLPIVLIAKSVVEAFFYPYALFFVLGFIGLRRRVRQEPPLSYFMLLMVFSTVVLYIHLLQTWLLVHRFLSILIYPACLLVGMGIDYLMRWLRDKMGFRPAVAAGCMVAFIVASGAGKNLHPEHADKLVYREIAQRIADQKAPGEVVRIAGRHSTVYEWIFFYAHRDGSRPLCARSFLSTIPKKYEQLPKAMRRNHTQYLLFEEKEWRAGSYNFMESPYDKDFEVLGRWRHRDTGAVMLLKLKEVNPPLTQ